MSKSNSFKWHPRTMPIHILKVATSIVTLVSQVSPFSSRRLASSRCCCSILCLCSVASSTLWSFSFAVTSCHSLAAANNNAASHIAVYPAEHCYHIQFDVHWFHNINNHRNCLLCHWNITSFYRAMLCIRGTSHGPVSVCLWLFVCHNSKFY